MLEFGQFSRAILCCRPLLGNEPRHFVAGDRAVSEWRFTGTTADGVKVEVNGCDVFTLRGGKIVVKNSYRKQRTT